jgi:MSHA pilin protein MshD
MSSKKQRGVTLIELVIFIVIVGIGLAGILQMLNLSTRMSADPVRRKQALLMAEGLLEEVELARFTYCDPTDPNAVTALSAAVGATACSSAALVVKIGQPGGAPRPFYNVSNYVTAFADEEQAFNNANGVLVDAAGNPYLANNVNTTYKAYLTITATDKLGPGGNTIASDNTALNNNVLRITVRLNYGSGTDDNIVLEGYRTRYAPNAVP